MKPILILALTTSTCAFAQERPNVIHYQASGPDGVIVQGGMAISAEPPVKGAPYSATITNTDTQTLPDGNHIVQTMHGSTARDSEGRTRLEAPTPAVADPSASAHPPRLVFLQDPVAHTGYVLDLSNKTAHETPVGGPDSTKVFRTQTVAREGSAASIDTPFGIAAEPVMMVTTGGMPANRDAHTEKLGSQTMEGLLVTGVRTIDVIPAGKIGNAQPIEVVSEVWTSPELQTIVYSKLTDPRTGEHVLQLSNVQRAEPAPSLFTVPSDFQRVDGPEFLSAGSDE